MPAAVEQSVSTCTSTSKGMLTLCCLVWRGRTSAAREVLVLVVCITERWVKYRVDVRLSTVSGGDMAACETASALGLLSPSLLGSCALGGRAIEFVALPTPSLRGGTKLPCPRCSTFASRCQHMMKSRLWEDGEPHYALGAAALHTCYLTASTCLCHWA
jgi:hypothetical protein